MIWLAICTAAIGGLTLGYAGGAALDYDATLDPKARRDARRGFLLTLALWAVSIGAAAAA